MKAGGYTKKGKKQRKEKMDEILTWADKHRPKQAKRKKARR